jgi:hypothetical protein
MGRRYSEQELEQKTIEYIEKFKIVHIDGTYDYSNFKFLGVDVPAEIKCNICNFIFTQIPYNHCKGSGCPKCTRKNVGKQNRSNFDDLLKKAFEIHGDIFDYSNYTFVNVDTPSEIKCKICLNVFYQNMQNHINAKQGCGTCKNKQNGLNRRSTQEDIINKIIEIYGNQFNCSEVNYQGNDKKIKLLCNNCNTFIYKTPHNLLSGRSCLNCENINRRKTKEQFIIDAIMVHGQLRYDYSLVEYINVHTKISIKCNNCLNIFTQTPTNHLIGRGCKYCAFRKSSCISKQETLWLDTYNIASENRNIHLKIDNKRFNIDGFDPHTNTIYEFYGDYWHGNILKFAPNDINKRTKKTFGEIYTKTIERETILKQAGYNLITIWESDWKAQNKASK